MKDIRQIWLSHFPTVLVLVLPIATSSLRLSASQRFKQRRVPFGSRPVCEFVLDSESLLITNSGGSSNDETLSTNPSIISARNAAPDS